MECYNETVMDFFNNPRNAGKIEDASGIGNAGSPVCGDMMRLYIKVEDGIIKDAKFKTFGCGAAIASSSMLTEIIKGKTIEEAERTNNREVLSRLGDLPSIKRHCSILAEEALEAAIKDYRKKRDSRIS